MTADRARPADPGADDAAVRDGGQLGGVGGDALWNTANLVVNSSAGFLAVAIGVRVLGDQVFGVFVVLNSFLLLASVLQGGLGASLQYAAAKALTGDAEQRRRLQVGHSVFCCLGATVVLVGVGLAFVLPALVRIPTDQVTAARVTCLLIALSTAVAWASAAVASAAVGLLRYDLLFLANASSAGVRIALLLLLVEPLGLLGLGLSGFAGSLVGVLPLLYIARRHVPWLQMRPVRMRRDEVVSLLGFTFPLFVLSASGLLMSASDAILINALVGPAAVTTFRVGLQVPQLAQSIAQAAYTSMYPRMARLRDETTQQDTVSLSASWLCYAAGAGFASLLVLREDVLLVTVGKVDPVTSTIYAVYCAIFLLDICFYPWVTLILARGRSSIIAKLVPVELVLNLLLTWLLVVRFGAVGSAYAAVVTLLVADLLLFPFLARGVFSRPAAILVLRRGVAPAVGGAVLAGSCALVVREATDGLVAHLLGALVGSVLVVLVVGVLLMGRSSRSLLRGAFSR